MSISISSEALGNTHSLNLKVNVFKMPEVVELAAVTTAGHYIVSSHLVRALTKLDKFGKIQSDLAIKWHHSDDHKVWRIWIGSANFSNGEPITAADVVDSIQKQVNLKTGVHFLFSEIEKVSLDKQNSVAIKLKASRTDFVYDLSKPEFGVLHKSDVLAKKGESTFAVSSGPYYLLKKEASEYHLKRNKYFKSERSNDRDLIIGNSDSELSPTALVNGSIDFFTTQQNLSSTRHHNIELVKELSATKPHIAFSYWLSLNSMSEYFAKKENRAKFQSIVKDFNSPELNNHSWQKADQLYLPDGDGRPSSAELDSVWVSIVKLANAVQSKIKIKLRIVPLKMTNTLITELTSYLSKFYDIEIISYTTEDELIKIIQDGKFDIKISSNDFSSIDLSENLKTTFNASRPYIFLNKTSPIKELMTKAATLDDKAEQSVIYKKIGLNLLMEGLIAPLAYQRVWYYYKRSLDISAWSTIYPEISFWKVKYNE